MKKKLAFLAFGLVFGFSLSRVGASDYNSIYAMFTGENLKLAWVMMTAIVTGFIGMRILMMTGARGIGGKPITINKKPLSRLNAIGGSIFGIGWGMAGACPGTILAQVGEGKLLGFFTLIGIIAGTYLYAILVEKLTFLNI